MAHIISLMGAGFVQSPIPYEYYQEYLAHIAFKQAMGRKYETFEEYITSRKTLLGRIMSSEIKDLTTEIRKLSREIETLNSGNRRLKSEIQTLSSEIRTLGSHI